MKERKIITKTTLHQMNVHIKKKGKVNFIDLWEPKETFFNAGIW